MAREIMAEVAYRESAERLANFSERGDVQPLAIESKDGRINVYRLKDTRPHSVVERALRPQTRIDVRALEMVRAYPLYVKEHTDHEPPIGEVLEQCIINTLNGDTDFIEWLERQPRAELIGEQANNSTLEKRDLSTSD